MTDDELHQTEPEEYQLLTLSDFNTVTLGDTERCFGFCVNSPGAMGYCDHAGMWIADQLTDPHRALEVAVHECLHGIFPELTEDQVARAGEQIAAVVMGVWKVKGTGPIPPLKPILTRENAKVLFPDLKWRED